MPRNRKFISGASISLISPLVLIVTSPLVARLLGPEGRGQLSLLLIPLVILDIIACAGLPNLIISKAKDYKQSLDLVVLYRDKIRLALLSASLFSVAISLLIHRQTGLNLFLILILLNSFRSARRIETKRAIAVASGDIKVYNVERIVLPIVRLFSTAISLLLNVNNPLLFAFIQIYSGIVTSQVLFRKYRLTLRYAQLRDKVSDLKYSIGGYQSWAIIENLNYWGVLLIIGLVIPNYEFGILAIGLVAGEIFGATEKFLMHYISGFGRNDVSWAFSRIIKMLTLAIPIYCVSAYVLIPIVFGEAFSESAHLSVICIFATYLRILMRLTIYKYVQVNSAKFALRIEGATLSVAIISMVLLSQIPSALNGSLALLFTYAIGFYFSQILIKARTIK